jgi:hypothetical protein
VMTRLACGSTASGHEPLKHRIGRRVEPESASTAGPNVISARIGNDAIAVSRRFSRPSGP